MSFLDLTFVSNKPYTVIGEMEDLIQSMKYVVIIGVGISTTDYKVLSRSGWSQKHLRKYIVKIQPDISHGHFWFQIRDGKETKSFMYCTMLDRERTLGFQSVKCGDPMCVLEGVHRE